LLADDSEEAEELLEDFEKSRPTEKLYSDILLPALQLAKTDHGLGTLDDQRLAFIIQELRDHIEVRRLRDQAKRQSNADAAEAAEAANAQSNEHAASSVAGVPQSSTPPPERAFFIPNGRTINVLCVPAQDEPDEIVGLMLMHLLEDQGFGTQCLTAATLASEMVESVKRFPADLVVISALPPRAVSHARYLCLRLQANFRDIPILVGIWTAHGDAKKMQDRISSAASAQLSTNLGEALTRIHQMIQPLLVNKVDDKVQKHESVIIMEKNRPGENVPRIELKPEIKEGVRNGG
jgi:hypothetical protein